MSMNRVLAFAAAVLVLGVAPGMASKGAYEPGLWEGPTQAALPSTGSGACVTLADAGGPGTTDID